MRRHIPHVIVMAVGIPISAGCNTPNNKARAYIEYDPIANFYDYRLSPDSLDSHGAGNGMFIQYKIKKIANTGSEAQSYIFNRHKIVAITPDQTSNEEPSGDNILLGPKLVNNLTAPAGQTVIDPGCIIKHVLTPNPRTLDNTSALVDIIHQIDPSQPVTMIRTAGDNSTAVVGNALPTTLQELCGHVGEH